MRYLVRLEANVPPDLDPSDLDRLNAAETARGAELVQAGLIEQIWRVSGRRANAGIWDAETLDDLHGMLDSLPMREYVDVASIDALEEHPVTLAARSNRTRSGGDDGATR